MNLKLSRDLVVILQMGGLLNIALTGKSMVVMTLGLNPLNNNMVPMAGPLSLSR